MKAISDWLNLIVAAVVLIVAVGAGLDFTVSAVGRGVVTPLDREAFGTGVVLLVGSVIPAFFLFRSIREMRRRKDSAPPPKF